MGSSKSSYLGLVIIYTIVGPNVIPLKKTQIKRIEGEIFKWHLV